RDRTRQPEEHHGKVRGSWSVTEARGKRAQPCLTTTHSFFTLSHSGWKISSLLRYRSMVSVKGRSARQYSRKATGKFFSRTACSPNCRCCVLASQSTSQLLSRISWAKVFSASIKR